jgi:hypothetical protein
MAKQGTDPLRVLNVVAGCTHLALAGTFAVVALNHLVFSGKRKLPGIHTSTYTVLPKVELGAPGGRYTNSGVQAELVVDGGEWLLPALAVGFVLVTALFHLLVYRGRKYEANVENNRNPLRWLEYGLTATTMVVIVALSFGLREFNTLLALAAIIVQLMALGFATEVISEPRYKWIAHAAGWVSYAVLWGVLLNHVLLVVNRIGEARRQVRGAQATPPPPALVPAPSDLKSELDSSLAELELLVWLASSAILVFFSVFGVIQFIQLLYLRTKQPEQAKKIGRRTEFAYVGSSLASKAVLIGVLFWGWFGRSQVPMN